MIFNKPPSPECPGPDPSTADAHRLRQVSRPHPRGRSRSCTTKAIHRCRTGSTHEESRIAWWLQVLHRERFTDEDRQFIESRSMFFLATTDADGWPDCSYKGGLPGFVAVLETLARWPFPSYDGNGMFRSLGNIAVNPRVGMLFIDFEQRLAHARKRHRVGPPRRGQSGPHLPRALRQSSASTSSGSSRTAPATSTKCSCSSRIPSTRQPRPRAADARMERDGCVSRLPAAAAAWRPGDGLERPSDRQQAVSLPHGTGIRRRPAA